MNYYNENDSFAAQWLEELIKDGLIAAGEVDTRSIEDVEPNDLQDFKQCHFFAGIGGWAYAARLSGWGDDRPMWTGSPPCQPFSVAGAQRGEDDPRNLWPDTARLIRGLGVPIVFLENVPGILRYYFDTIRPELREMGYEVTEGLFSAAETGAPHKRQRLFILGYR